MTSNLKDDIMNWLTDRDYNHKLRGMKLLQDLTIAVVLLILFFAIFPFAAQLNQDPVIFFRIGAVILLAILFFSLKFFHKSYRNAAYGFKGAPNFVKVLLLIFVLLGALYLFQNQKIVGGIFNEKNKDELIDKLNPIYFSNTITAKNNSSSLVSTSDSHPGLAEYVGGTISTAQEVQQELFPPPNIDEIEKIVFEKTNALRGKKLIWSPKLAQMARAHSQDMAQRKYFAHDSPEGLSPSDRAKKIGLSEYGIAENIAQAQYGSLYCGDNPVMTVSNDEDVATCAVNAWIKSPGHYANMIDPEFVEIGVGVAYDGEEFYLTQNFRVPYD
ncbi:MAG: CAP domain-containing protein [Candidatus Diapherotrites archaeon]|nr:CAP domain-containing protein [Candidatus Diapherotrites archaeon]